MSHAFVLLYMDTWLSKASISIAFIDSIFIFSECLAKLSLKSYCLR
jgi:hypothetical protein